jgi:hypothetical protein
VRLADFEALIRRLCGEVPSDFLDGISEIVVSPRVVPDLDRPEIFTLGECVPLPVQVGSGVEGVQSRIVLYHGSFVALAQQSAEFDWRREAWDTLSHELRHHLEWRAQAPDLEAFDWAVEHNFARQDGELFDPVFFLSGEAGPDGVYRVEDDLFLDRIVRSLPEAVDFQWGGRSYRAPVPPGAELPCFLTVEGLVDPPEGDLVLVLRRRPGVRDLFVSSSVYQATVRATS